MIELILLYFLSISIGKQAKKKGLPPLKWKLILLAAWITFEFVGISLGVAFFGMDNLPALMALGIASAFGGYLLVRYILENKPDINSFDDIDQIGNN